MDLEQWLKALLPYGGSIGVIAALTWFAKVTGFKFAKQPSSNGSVSSGIEATLVKQGLDIASNLSANSMQHTIILQQLVKSSESVIAELQQNASLLRKIGGDLTLAMERQRNMATAISEFKHR